MGDTKTRGRSRTRVVSLSAANRQGTTLLDRLPDSSAAIPGAPPELAANAEGTLDVLAGVLEASIRVGSPNLVKPHLRTMFAGSITSDRTRELLQLVYRNGGDRLLPYLFGLGEDGRRISRLSFAPLDVPARILWPGSRARQQNAWTLLDRIRPTLRMNLLMVLACRNPDLFLSLLFRFGLDGWRKGVVDRLAGRRETIQRDAPLEASALSDISKPALKRAVQLLSKIQSNDPLALPLFSTAYGALRFSGLYTASGDDAAGLLHSAIRSLPRADSPAAQMARRALERPLHLLRVPDEWDAFISKLLDWVQDPRGEGATFAAYTACYYLDLLDDRLWNGLPDPYSIAAAWTVEALHAVLEESDKNISESWYRAPHHATINTLRALNYIRAHPNPSLEHRDRIVCLRLARSGLGALPKLSHSRSEEARIWFESLESMALKP